MSVMSAGWLGIASVCVWTLIACGPSKPGAGPTTFRLPIPCDSLNSSDLSGLDSTLRDTEREINPTAVQTTERAISMVEKAIARYRCERGILPVTLDSLLSLGPPAAIPAEVMVPKRWWFIDGWDRPLRYKVNGAMYELRSIGADGEEHTSDDLLSRGTPLEAH